MIAFQDFCYVPNPTRHVIVVVVHQDHWRDDPINPQFEEWQLFDQLTKWFPNNISRRHVGQR